MTFMSKNKKTIKIIFVLVLMVLVVGWGLNQLRGHGYGTMVKTYIRYWLNPVDLKDYEPLAIDSAKWLEEDTLLAHAMAGIDNSTYTNSLEAFETAYDNGFRVYEVDLAMTKEGKVICSHEYLDENGDRLEYESFMGKKIEDKYTPIDIKGLIELMEVYPDVYIMTDFKWDNSMGSTNEEVNVIMSAIVQEALQRNREDLLERIIVQIYNPTSYEIIHKIYPFKNYVYTLYHYVSPIYEEILGFCLEHKIPIVAMEKSRITKERVEYFTDWNVDVLSYTINDESTAENFREFGVKGIYTDWLMPE